MLRDRHFWMVVAAGLFLGGLGALLAVWGNPENSGICVSCFMENSAGALGMHDNPRMQYLRPELIGFVLGAAASALLFREFRSRGGGAPCRASLRECSSLSAVPSSSAAPSSSSCAWLPAT
ncbi:hypothetical protein [Geobacter anodireducens]